MDASVFSFRNNSNEVQEFSVFETSALGAPSTNTQIVWNFEADFSPVYTDGVNQWWNNKIVASNGNFAVRVFTTTGTTFIVSSTLPTDPLLSNLRTVQFEAYLNNAANPFAVMGEWEIEGPYANAIGGGNSSFIIRCTVSQTFIDDRNIATTPEKNYGVESMELGGNTGGAQWGPVQVFPSAGAVAPSLPSNPNISVVSTSNFPYDDFLYSTIQRTYDIKNFQIFSRNQDQLLEPFLFDRTLATGKVYQKVLTPTIDPYQSQNYIITPDGKGYILDGFTKIKYSLLPLTTVRLVLDYTYIDISTPLIAKVQAPKINKDYITPDFVDNMEKGYDKYGCDFLIKRSKYLSEKLKWIKEGKPSNSEFANQSGSSVAAVSTSNAGKNPIWQDQIKSKLIYIKQLMINYDCFPKEEIEEMPQFDMIGSTFKRTNLWMPSPEFVQHQLDTEQGARKLFRKHDFPIEKE